jgi:hypothetical protein
MTDCQLCKTVLNNYGKTEWNINFNLYNSIYQEGRLWKWRTFEYLSILNNGDLPAVLLTKSHE